ncbi:MAG: TIGR03905 family TSCPD domain-containing protein [Coriobacteriales bacterium]|jgi:uncharacterized protein (TIGR03905 family)|nr:TIGR03905 family TSCPD domain-containing protein [Coriobacteriales bacterium]
MPTVQLQGVCARTLDYEVVDGAVHNVKFNGGCPGNALGLSYLVEGRPVQGVIDLLEGIPCGGKGTSCPDQLAQTLKAHV